MRFSSTGPTNTAPTSAARNRPAASELAGRLEIALTADDVGVVHAFYGTAIAAGGRAGSEPGVRPEYNREYYSARVFDFDGNSLEAVFRGEATPAALQRPAAA